MWKYQQKMSTLCLHTSTQGFLQIRKSQFYQKGSILVYVVVCRKTEWIIQGKD